MPVPTAVRSLVVVALALASTACQDAITAPIAPTGAAPTPLATHEQALSCRVDVGARTLGCAAALPSGTPAASAGPAEQANGPRRSVIFGNQNVYVRLTGSATGYQNGVLTVPVKLQNLVAQAMGTADGTTYDGHGVTVFFQQAPTVTSGTGTVTVVNADMVGTFTAAGQQAFIYPQLLAGNQTTPEHDWLFSVPASVASFQFVVLVRAQLPDESIPLVAQPAHVFATGATPGIIGGAEHSCAIRPGAGVYCWGSTPVQVESGQANASYSAVPLLVPGSAGAVALAAGTGASHACWLTGTGAAACVGSNTFGQLGDGTTTDALTARSVTRPAGVTGFTRLAAGLGHSCAVSTAGAAYCWGFGGLGQLGDGTGADATTPVAVQMPGGVQFAGIAAGELHSCARTTAGAAYCWGDNSYGQLGNGTYAAAGTPVTVALPAGVVLTQISEGGFFTCGIATNGSAYCWGENSHGQLGNGATTNQSTPQRVLTPAGVTLTQLATGGDHACARASSGAVYCWGNGSSGQLGDGAYTESSTPVSVTLPGGAPAAQVSAGGVGSGSGGHSCAIAATGEAYCWGRNAFGQLGNGNQNDRGTPDAVRMP